MWNKFAQNFLFTLLLALLSLSFISAACDNYGVWCFNKIQCPGDNCGINIFYSLKAFYNEYIKSCKIIILDCIDSICQ